MRGTPENKTTEESFVTAGIQAIRGMPIGETGLVLGTGENTPEWKNRGWLTLDISPRQKADFTADARYTPEILRRTDHYPLDYLAAEGIWFGEPPKWFELDKRLANQLKHTILPSSTGITIEELTEVANQSLKDGGVFVYIGASEEWLPTMEEELSHLGFETRIQEVEWVKRNPDHSPITAPAVFAKKR